MADDGDDEDGDDDATGRPLFFGKRCPHVCLKNVTVFFPASISGFVRLRQGRGKNIVVSQR